MSAIAAPWEHSVGMLPHKVTVYEHPRKGRVLYLRWRVDGNWGRKSLGVKLRDARGRVIPEVQRMALAEATRQVEVLSGVRVVEGAAAPARPLRLGETWARLTDGATGKYPIDTPHRREVRRELANAVRILGADLPWTVVDRARYRMLGRTRIDELRAAGRTGYRGAEVTLARVIAVGAWLRDEEVIPTDAGHAPSSWKDELRGYWSDVAQRGDIPVSRLRYTLAEVLDLLAVAPLVDPRLALLMDLGIEQRLGQVARCWRRHLDREQGMLQIPGLKKKRGALLELTPGQLAEVDRALSPDGYLGALEAAPTIDDYPLFPGGPLPGGRSGTPAADPARHAAGPIVTTSAMRDWWREAEFVAGIPHVSGRLWYGGRRVGVDEAKKLKISREGLQQHGGWSTAQIPDAIYADQEAGYARSEAAEVRAKIRGEQQSTSQEPGA